MGYLVVITMFVAIGSIVPAFAQRGSDGTIATTGDCTNRYRICRERSTARGYEYGGFYGCKHKLYACQQSGSWPGRNAR